MLPKPRGWIAFGVGPVFLCQLPATAQELPAALPRTTAPVPQATAPATTGQPRLTPESAVLQALANDPVTAPYAFRAEQFNGRIVLAGRVGSKLVHDEAIRIALAVTPSIDDRLVIDTAVSLRARGVPAPFLGGPAYLPGVAPLIYPPPLFGRLDDPFYGFEPPILSYPPWWPQVVARQGDPYAAPVLNPAAPIGPDPGPAVESVPKAPAPAQTPATGDTVEMSIDPRGVATLRGTVNTAGDREAIGQKVARMKGVSEVINRIDVRSDSPETSAPTRGSDVPPPPPTPAGEVAPAPTPAAAPAPAIHPDSGVPPSVKPSSGTARTGDDAALDRRLAENLGQRPALAGTTIRTSVRDGVAYLTGKVPTALEAMLAFRAAQKTIGIRDVVDRLEFAVPDGRGQNPLIARGRPEDIEPYLEAQIRRQVDDQAHIDRVRVAGDRLEVTGTVAKAEDKPRIEAILRSMPLLRGFTLDTTFVAE